MVDPQHGEHGVDTQEGRPLHQLEGCRIDVHLCEVHLEKEDVITVLSDIFWLKLFLLFLQQILTIIGIVVLNIYEPLFTPSNSKGNI